MAERVIAVKMTLDAGQTVEELETIAEQLTDIEDDIRNVDKASADQKALKNFEKLNKVVEDNVLSIQELGVAADNYKNIALAAGKESPVGKEALKRAAEMEKQIDETTRSVDALKEGGVALNAALQLGAGVTAGYTAFQGVTALVGVENEKLEETFVKLQAAQSVLAGLTELKVALDSKGLLVTQAKNIAEKAGIGITKAATIAQRLFNVVLSANPIGLIVTGIGLLIGAFVALGKNAEAVKDAVVGFFMAIASFFGLVSDEEAKAAEAAQRHREALAAQATARINELKKLRDQERSAHEARQNQFDLEIERLEAVGKSSFQLRLQKAEDLKAELQNQIAFIKNSTEVWRKYYEGLAAQSGKSREDFIAQLKGQGIDLEKLQQEQQDLLTDLESKVFSAESKILKIKTDQRKKDKAAAEKHAKELEAIEAKRLAAIEKMLQDQVKANEKAADDLFKKRQDILNRISEFEQNRFLSDVQIRMRNLQEQFDAEMELLGKHSDARLLLQDEFNEKMRELQAEADAANAEQDAVKFQGRIDQINEGLAIAQEALALAQEINGLLDQLSEHRKEKIQTERDEDLKSLEANKNAQLKRENLTANQRIQIENQFALAKFQTEKKAAEAEDKIARKQFQRKKALKLVEIAINTASSVMQALGSFPPPASFIFAGINATMGIVQAAIVAAQKFKGTAGSVAPPTFTPPSIEAGAGGGGGGGAGGGAGTGGPLQDDIITSTADLPTSTKVEVSQVEINETQNEMANVEEVSTIV